MQLIAVGTSIFGGSGTRPKVDQAVLFLWNYQAEKKNWEGTLDRPVSVFNALLTGFDARLYGTVHGGSQPGRPGPDQAVPVGLGCHLQRVCWPPGALRAVFLW